MNQNITNPVKVLFIAGPTRSGSTILSKILGEIDGCFDAGELIDIWDRGLAPSGSCSCGVALDKCSLWLSVFDKAYGGINNIDVEKMIESRDRAAHTRNVLLLLLKPRMKSKLESSLSYYFSNLMRLYRAIQSATGCSLIIDSSKNVGYAFLLGMIPQIDLHLLHLIRDPRATAYSWLQKKPGLWIANPFETSLVWSIRNLVVELISRQSLDRHLRLHYEDFIDNPKETVLRILDLVKHQSLNAPFVDHNTVKLGENHSIYGNPDRFRRGFVQLKMDQRWRDMRKKHFFIVTFLTWPFLIKYRYSLIPRFSNHD